jgi:hypothetical protein
MKRLDITTLAILVGIFLVTIFVAAVASSANDKTYQQHVCKYLGGTMHADLCIKNGEVVEIPKD